MLMTCFQKIDAKTLPVLGRWIITDLGREAFLTTEMTTVSLGLPVKRSSKEA